MRLSLSAIYKFFFPDKFRFFGFIFIVLGAVFLWPLVGNYDPTFNPARLENQPTTIASQLAKQPVTSGLTETIPILMYHYIEIAPASTKIPSLYLDPLIFDQQLQALSKNGYQPLKMSVIAKSLQDRQKLEAKAIALTFDDGYEDFYTQVFPLLKKYQLQATLYIIINRLDTPGYLSKAQVRELADSGLVEIGSHTFNHPDLRKLKNKDAGFEISSSQQILEQIAGQPVTSLAYPFGFYNFELAKIASASGYTNAVSVSAGVKQGANNIFFLKRLRPSNRQGQVFADWLAAWFLAKE